MIWSMTNALLKYGDEIPKDRKNEMVQEILLFLNKSGDKIGVEEIDIEKEKVCSCIEKHGHQHVICLAFTFLVHHKQAEKQCLKNSNDENDIHSTNLAGKR